MSNTLKFGNGEWYGKEGTILAYNSENNNYKPLPFTFDRDSVATRVNKQGLIETVGADQPRIDYLNDSNGALLLEPSRTNLVEYSEDGTQWDTINATVSLTTDSTSPSGQSSVYKVNDNATDAQHRIDVDPPITSGTEYTFSAFVKKPSDSDIDFVYLLFSNKFPTTRFYFNIEEGTSLDSGGTIENYGNGWYRLSANATADSSGNGVCAVNLTNADNDNTYSGTGNGSMFVWGLQVESNASYPTSYIPTQGSAVTRLADSCSQTVPDGVIGQTEGTIYFESTINGLQGGDMRFQLSDGSTNNWIFLNSGEATGIGVKARAYINNGNVNQFNSYSAYLSEGNHKYALAYNVNDIAFYVDGVQVALDNSATIPSCDEITLSGSTPTSINASHFLSYKETKLYNTRLSNAELAALTQV